MNIGIDIGSAFIKHRSGLLVPSLLTKGKTINKGLTIEYEGDMWTIGEGIREVEINKAKRESNLKFIFGILGSLTKDIENNIVVGLPIGQYQQEKENYKNYILDNGYYRGAINGFLRMIRITGVTIAPEGLQAIREDYKGIVLDIGGRTTDICLIEEGKKVINPISKPIGTINLYSTIINKLNARYGLDLREQDAERIIKGGLMLDGCKVENNIVGETMTSYIEDIINTLKLEYSLRTNNLLMVGGGSELFYKSFKTRVKQAEKMENSIFANAEGYERLAVKIYG